MPRRCSYYVLLTILTTYVPVPAGALLLLRRRGCAHACAPAAGERTRAAATRAPARQLTPGVQGTRRVGARPFAIYDTLN